MTTNADHGTSTGSPWEHRILGSLVGACTGAAAAAATDGRPRSELIGGTGPVRGTSDPASTGQTGQQAGAALFAAEEAESTWVASAVRAGLARTCDPMAEFVDGLPPAGRDRLDAAAFAAVAAAVSATVDGCVPGQVTSLALMAADLAADRAPDCPGPDLAARLQWACALAARAEDDPDDVIDLLIGTSEVPQECVPAAFAFLAVHGQVGDPAAIEPLCARAARLGGASRVIAVVVGAVLGARCGDPGGTTNGSWPTLHPLCAELITSRSS